MRRVLLLALLLCLTLPSFAQDNSPSPYEIALQRIQEAEASGAIELDLSGLGLTQLPPEISNLSNLLWLNLQNNRLSTLPSEIGNLSNLHLLNLQNNRLSTLPSEIGNLNQLCYLGLANNQLRYLPTSLSVIEGFQGELCGIWLNDNPLISPPEEVIAQGTPAILDYLENEALWHLQRLILGAASSLGLVAAVILGLRWRHRGKQKRKRQD